MELTCESCAKSFTAKRRHARFCSASCRARASAVRAEADGRLAQWRANADARRVKPPGVRLTCHRCSVEFVHPHQRGTVPKYCTNFCAREAYHERRLADGRWAALKASQRGPGSSCESCDAPLRTGARRCRACADGRPHIPDATRRAVYERDGWECQLCDLPVVREARFPDPWCATLDHVVPFSLGGGDEEDNLQLAHFRCNCQKQDRLDFVA